MRCFHRWTKPYAESEHGLHWWIIISLKKLFTLLPFSLSSRIQDCRGSVLEQVVTFMSASSREMTKWSAPKILVASSRFFSLVESTVTSQPIALAIFTACRFMHEHWSASHYCECKSLNGSLNSILISQHSMESSEYLPCEVFMWITELQLSYWLLFFIIQQPYDEGDIAAHMTWFTSYWYEGAGGRAYHVAKTTQSQNTDLHARLVQAEVTQGWEHSDTGAQERCSSCQVQVRWHPQHEAAKKAGGSSAWLGNVRCDKKMGLQQIYFCASLRQWTKST